MSTSNYRLLCASIKNELSFFKFSLEVLFWNLHSSYSCHGRVECRMAPHYVSDVEHLELYRQREIMLRMTLSDSAGVTRLRLTCVSRNFNEDITSQQWRWRSGFE